MGIKSRGVRRLGLSRRGFFVGVVAIAVGLPNYTFARPDAGTGQAVALVRLLAAITLPDSDTPGAGTDDVATWVVLALDHGMMGGNAATVGDLGRMLDAATPGGSFLTAAPLVQLAALNSLDKALNPFAAPVAPQPWAITKSLIVRSYYNSEIGASRELRYELVPGRFDPDLIVKPDERALSTDALARNSG